MSNHIKKKADLFLYTHAIWQICLADMPIIVHIISNRKTQMPRQVPNDAKADGNDRAEDTS